MSDTIPTFPNTPSWRGVQLEAQGQLYLYLSLGIKRPGREASHSSPSSAEVKNAWSYTSTPQSVFMEWYLVKHRDDFTLLLLYL